jgi:thioredoxin-like negative regulator of GroEL
MSATETHSRTNEPATTKPLLLFFHSPTEGYCRRVEGFLAQIMQRRKNHDTFRVSRIDITKRPDLAERFRITQIPALIVVTDNRVRARLDRPIGCTDIKQLLTPWLR